MRKRIGHNISLGSFLEAIIADRISRVQRFFNVTAFQYIFSLSIMCPHASQKIGLQLQLNRIAVVLGFIYLPAQTAHLSGSAIKVLDMMSHFMGYYISHCKITWRVQFGLQVLIK